MVGFFHLSTSHPSHINIYIFLFLTFNIFQVYLHTFFSLQKNYKNFKSRVSRIN